MVRVLFLTFSLFLTTTAFAQDLQGLYFAGTAGVGFSMPMASGSGSNKILTNAGPLGVIDLGWGFGNGLRAEIEGSYRSNGVASIPAHRTNGNYLPFSGTTGHVATSAIMSNLDYDLPVPDNALHLRPYVGVGVGYAWLQMDDVAGHAVGSFTGPGNNTYNGPETIRFGTGGAFAYQAIAGVAMPLAAMPGVSLIAEYRFFSTATEGVPTIRAADSAVTFNGMLAASRIVNTYTAYDNTLLIGARYAF